MAEASAIRGGAAGAFCAGVRRVHAFHLANKTVSGFGGASRAEVGAGASRGSFAEGLARGARRGSDTLFAKAAGGDGVGNFGSGEAGERGGARIDGLEDGAVYGAAPWRGIRGADYLGAEIRMLCGAV